MDLLLLVIIFKEK